MKTTRMVLKAACLLPLLSSCASYQSAGNETWGIKPFTSVRDSNLKPDAYYQLGRYYQGQKRYDQAIQAYQKALAVDESFAEARNGLGVVYAMQGKYAEALQELQLATRLSPNAAHIYNNLGYAYYLHGLYGEAVAALEKSVELQPGNQSAYNNLGLAYAKAGKKDKSLQAFTQAIQSITPQNTGETAVEAQDIHPDSSSRQMTASSREPGQTLSLPKDRGVIARPSVSVRMVESQSRMVAITPNVYELRTNAVPKQTVEATDKPSPATGKFHFEVSNGNGVTGMAKKVAKFLYGDGLPAARLTNQKPYQLPTSQIQYREGYQSEAIRLKSSLPNQPVLIQSENLRVNIDVRLVLGRDAIAHLTKFENGNDGNGKVKVATY